MVIMASQLLTNDHDVEVEPLPDTLAVPLVGEVGEPNISGQLPSHDVSVVVDGGS